MLAKILGHADLSLLMRYVHPAQEDMDRAMEWYSNMQKPGPELEAMLLEYEDENNPREDWPGPTTTQKVAQIGPSGPNSAKWRIS